jgi:aspartyl-tRNA(Asn)/glutamyl-tRNA(Gln) amidotransferase subunit A
VADYCKAAAAAGDLHAKRILFCTAPKGRAVSSEVARAFERALSHLESLGAELREMPVTTDFDIERLWRTINHTVWLARFGDWARERPEELSSSLLQQLELATNVSGVDYQRAMFDRTRLFRRVQSLLRENHLLAMPTLSRTALPIDQDLFGTIAIDAKTFPEVRANWFPWTMPFNLTGHPAVTLPCGFGGDGLPIGIQLVGRFRGEADLVHAASLLEASQGLLSRRPDLS